MIAARGEKCGLAADLLDDVKAQDVVVEAYRLVEVGHPKVNVADVGSVGDGLLVHGGVSFACARSSGLYCSIT